MLDIAGNDGRFISDNLRRLRRSLILAGAALVLLLVLVPIASGRSAVRSCGAIRFGIGTSVQATRNVSCDRARHVIRGLLHNTGCGGRRSCRVDGYRCRNRSFDQGTAIATTCVRGSRRIEATSGP